MLDRRFCSHCRFAKAGEAFEGSLHGSHAFNELLEHIDAVKKDSFVKDFPATIF